MQDVQNATGDLAFCLCVRSGTSDWTALAAALQSANYLRLEGRAVLVVCDAYLNPAFFEIAQRWRDDSRRLGTR